MSTLTVEAHRKRFTITARPLQPLSEVVDEVLAQLKITDLRAADCRLTVKGKVLDQSTPVRFANIGREKLELQTGREQVLGVQDGAPKAGSTASVAAAPPPTQQQSHGVGPSSTSSAQVADPVTTARQPQSSAAPPSSHPAQAAPAQPPAATPPHAPLADEPSSSSSQGAAGPLAAGAAHPSAAVFGQRVFVFTRDAEREAESGAADVQEGGEGEEEDEAFFVVTEADLRRAMASSANQRARQEGGHLMTAAMRERDEQRRAEAYGSVPVRLYLPDSQHCLQAALPATTLLSSVLELAARALRPEAAPGAFLFTTPPRTVLRRQDLSRSLYAAHMVPGVKLHVGLDASSTRAGTASQLLRDEVLALVEPPPPREDVMPHTSRPARQRQQQQQQAAGNGPSAAAGASGSAPAAGGRAAGSGSKPGGVPKWMKLSK